MTKFWTDASTGLAEATLNKGVYGDGYTNSAPDCIAYQIAYNGATWAVSSSVGSLKSYAAITATWVGADNRLDVDISGLTNDFVGTPCPVVSAMAAAAHASGPRYTPQASPTSTTVIAVRFEKNDDTYATAESTKMAFNLYLYGNLVQPMRWSQHYSDLLREPVQLPVYAVLILKDRTMTGQVIGASGTTIYGDPNDELSLPDEESADFILYGSAPTFEIVRGVYDVGDNRANTATRAMFGTTAYDFEKGDVMGALWMGFATHPIAGGFPFRGGMGMPSGGTLELDIREGHTRSGGVDFEVQDHDGGITTALKGTTFVGKTAIVLGGYQGQALKDMVFLHVGPITGFGVNRGVYSISIDTILVKLKRRLFGDVEAFKTTLSGAMNSSTTTIPLTDTSGLYDSLPAFLRPDPAGGGAPTDYRAAMILQCEDEYMRHEGGTGPVTVTRGVLGSTAVAHASGKAVKMLFAVDGNPLDFLVGLLVTRDPRLSPLDVANDFPGYYYDWSSVVDYTLTKGPLGMNVELGDLDLTTILGLVRDRYFADTFGRFVFSRAIDTESYLREAILKPLNTFLYPTRTGQLGMGIIRPPIDPNVPVLDKDSIIGTPALEFTSDDILNEVSVSYDYDPTSGDPDRETRVLDATSQSAYDRVGTDELEPKWVISSRNGESLSERLAKKKMRTHRDPNPTIPLEVLYSNAGIELGSVVRVTYPGLADPVRGLRDWDRYCLVVGRKVDWQQGTLRLDVMDTAYTDRRWGLISPSGTADYTAASDSVKGTYAFVSPLSNGDPTYTIV